MTNEKQARLLAAYKAVAAKYSPSVVSMATTAHTKLLSFVPNPMLLDVTRCMVELSETLTPFLPASKDTTHD